MVAAELRLELDGTVSFLLRNCHILLYAQNRSVLEFLLVSSMFKISEIRNEI